MVSQVPRLLLLLLFFDCCSFCSTTPLQLCCCLFSVFWFIFFFTSMGAQKSLRTCVKAAAYRPNHFLMFPCLCTRSGIISSKLNWSTSENVVLFDWLILLLPQISCDDVLLLRSPQCLGLLCQLCGARSGCTLDMYFCSLYFFSCADQNNF